MSPVLYLQARVILIAAFFMAVISTGAVSAQYEDDNEPADSTIYSSSRSNQYVDVWAEEEGNGFLNEGAHVRLIDADTGAIVFERSDELDNRRLDADDDLSPFWVGDHQFRIPASYIAGGLPVGRRLRIYTTDTDNASGNRYGNCRTRAGGDSRCTSDAIGAILCVGGTCSVPNRDPNGFLDSANCSNIFGWACDPDDFPASIDVEVWADNIGDAAGPFRVVGPSSANVYRPDLVAGGACGVTGNHGFDFSTPASLRDGNTYDVSVRAINTPAGNNPTLPNSPQRINCGGACVQPSGLSYTGNPTCTSDTTPALTIRSQGVNCYPHHAYFGIYRDLNNNGIREASEPQAAGGDQHTNALSGNLDTYSTSGYTLGEGRYVWRSRAWNSSDLQQGPDDPWQRLQIDTTSPTAASGLTLSCQFAGQVGGVNRFRIVADWDPAADTGCGLNPYPYQLQVAPNNTFNSAVYDSGWVDTTNHTTAATYDENRNIWGRVNTRDAATPPNPAATSSVEGPLLLTCAACGGCSSLCGNSVVDPGEQCDDGGTTAGDGCSPTCQNEAASPPSLLYCPL